MKYSLISNCLMLSFLLMTAPVLAQESDSERYTVQPGDTLEVSVWREEDLLREVLVRPDGLFSFPLVGDIDANNQTVDDLAAEVTRRLARFISDPVVTVTLRGIDGNKIYILGQVNDPGAFVVNPRVDVMQALSLAGGTTPFASLNDIVILRRNRDGTQSAMSFKYKDVERGRDLHQNILLESGDLVIVP